MQLITTSWDDGHPLDFRIAEMLDKYGLEGTFYIPQHNGQQQMLDEQQIYRLSQRYEIGGHTLHHVPLSPSNRSVWDAEIQGSYEWLTHLTGQRPVSFCFPNGVYSADALATVLQSGYRLARTTELLSTSSLPETSLSPTSLQVYPHSEYTYTKHLVKRKKWKRLAAKLFLAPATDLVRLTDYYLDTIEKEGGCFHLWGHSWEIEQFGLWQKLEAIFQRLALRKHFQFIQNQRLLAFK